ncbi:MAG: thioesterase family protein [Acidobacteriota bacterium]
MTRGPAHAVSAWRDGWYVVPWDVTFRDLDSFGHVNNAVYFTYFELARTRLWFAITGGEEPSDVSFIVARGECDFRAQLGMERIEISVRIGEMRSTSFDFHTEIRRSGDGVLAATGKVVVVFFDWKTNSKVPLSDELRQKVRAFQKE